MTTSRVVGRERRLPPSKLTVSTVTYSWSSVEPAVLVRGECAGADECFSGRGFSHMFYTSRDRITVGDDVAGTEVLSRGRLVGVPRSPRGLVVERVCSRAMSDSYDGGDGPAPSRFPLGEADDRLDGDPVTPSERGEYACASCGNTQRFVRRVVVDQPYEYRQTNDEEQWATPEHCHDEPFVRTDVVWCRDCGEQVY
jgi:hypothetical protein